MVCAAALGRSLGRRAPAMAAVGGAQGGTSRGLGLRGAHRPPFFAFANQSGPGCRRDRVRPGRVGRAARELLLGLAGALGIAGLGWTAWRQTPLPIVASTWGADQRAGIGETRRVALADGTEVWLKALSA